MSVPVIATTTSVQGHKQWEQWTFQPFATGAPFRWEASTLPDGITLHTPAEYATTGVAATDVITATASAFANRAPFVFHSIAGPSELVADTIYYVRDVSGATFKAAATPGGPAIDFTVDISAAVLSALPTGAISGAATVAGVWDVALTAFNADGPSAALVFPIGIEPAANSLRSGVDLSVDLLTGLVTIDGVIIAEGEPLFAVKEDDDLLLYIQFKRGETVVELGTVSSLKFALKELEPEAAVTLGGGASGGSTPDIVIAKIGTGTATTYVCVCKFDGDKIAAALSNYEDDVETGFLGLGELEWVEANAATASYGPATLRRSSRTFRVKVTRDLVEG